jgi:hypothetical protein
MKKLARVLIFLLLSAAAFQGEALFAEDAKVLPMMTGRISAGLNYSFGLGWYHNGAYQKFDEDSIKYFNLGFDFEFGVNDWVTANFKWIPGWTFYSDLRALTSNLYPSITADTTTNGGVDIFAGAKFQIAGEKAPLKSELFRFAIAPGVIIPLPGPNFQDEYTNLMKGEKATVSKMDNHVFAAGGRFYFDWIINQSLFINLFNETIFYPVKQDLNKDGPNLAGAKALIPSGVYKAVYDGLGGAANPEAAATAAAAQGMAANDLKNAS